jgi:hypothetical protein
MLGPNVDQKTNSGIPTISGLALMYQGVVETVFSQSLAPIAKFNNVFSDHSMNNVDMEFLLIRPPCE